MPFPFKISVAGLGALTTVQATPSTGPAWDYSNREWTINECGQGFGNQSPINIERTATVEGSTLSPPQSFAFDPQGFPDSAATAAIQSGLLINDHTWEVDWDRHNNATDEYGLVIGDRIYRLREFHYHSPSEHLIDGNHYDMEAHHVHFCDGPSCQTPLNPNDEILVVSVFLQVGAPNPYLGSFWNQFHSGSETAISDMASPYTSFMPTDKSYYSYVGSTTTPPCATNVQWIVMQNPVEMSREQLDAYHTSVNTLPKPALADTQPAGVSPGWNAATTKTNNRPQQQLGTRTVSRFTQPPAESTPEDPLHPTTIDGIPWGPVLVASAAIAMLTAGICLFCNLGAPKGKTRAVVKKPPRPPPQAPKEETVPLMVPTPQLAAPNLSMIVQPQPLMQVMPPAYTTMARPAAVAPYGQAPVVLQP